MNPDISEKNKLTKAEWVMGKYVGERAKYVLGLANDGIGYFTLEQPDNGTGWVVVAFCRVNKTPLPPELQKVTDLRLLDKLEAWRNK